MRTALIDLDSPPEWWKEDNSDFLSAQEARDLVNTTGEALPSCPFSVQGDFDHASHDNECKCLKATCKVALPAPADLDICIEC